MEVQNTYTAYANETESGTIEGNYSSYSEETTKNPRNNSKIPKESIISKISPSKSKTVVLFGIQNCTWEQGKWIKGRKSSS